MPYFLRHPLLRSHLAGLAALLVHSLRLAAQARAERRLHAIACRELREIDAHTLRDIGLSHRAAAEHHRVPWH